MTWTTFIKDNQSELIKEGINKETMRLWFLSPPKGFPNKTHKAVILGLAKRMLSPREYGAVATSLANDYLYYK